MKLGDFRYLINLTLARTIARVLNVTAVSMTLIMVIGAFQGCYIVDDGNLNSGCTGDCTTITGRFTTQDGKMGVGSMPLELAWHTPSQMSALTGRMRRIATSKTDAFGNYSITFHAEDEEIMSGLFALKFEPPAAFMTHRHYTFFEFTLNKRDTIAVRDYHIPKIDAAIHLKIVNPQDVDEGDKISCEVSFEYDDLRYQKRINAGGIYLNQVTEATYNTASVQYTYIQVLKEKDGQHFNHIDSVRIAPNTIVSYQVVF